MRIHKGLNSLRQILDNHVVGQDSVKEAVLLGLLAREHVYIEGPPGVAKTFMSELVCESSNLSHWFYQMHRDTRLNEIVGEAIIVKDTTQAGEIIRQDILRGGVLNCELAVLDDISRAPGEALNVLLRILNERKYGSGPECRIPLLSAIATGNPAQDESYYAEPLDPATLDRFTLQLRVTGLVNEGKWSAVEDVIDRYSSPPLASDSCHINSVGRDIIIEGGELVPSVVLGEPTKKVLVEFLRVLNEDYELGESNAILTDRTFLIKAVKILKAQAVLDGRQVCEPRDLFAMRFLTTFRIPSKIHEKIEQIISDILSKHAPASPAAGEGTDDKASTSGAASVDETDEGQAAQQQEANKQPTKKEAVGSETINITEHTRELKEMYAPPHDAAQVDGLDTLLRRLKGEIDKGTAAQVDHPGGLPRTWHKPPTLSDLVDADPIETALWCQNPIPSLPRSQRRTKPHLGGRFAIIRDTSLSMQGPWNDWASLLCPKVVDLAKDNKMRVGYLEFNSAVDKFVGGDPPRFFTNEYARLSSRMHYVRVRGNTNYEAPLSIALSEFGRGSRNGQQQRNGMQRVQRKPSNQHILFITDGHPSTGSLTVEREIEAAQNLGVALHTVFIGYGECPSVLDKMSLRTKGSRHAAQFAPGDRKSVV